MIAEMDQLVKRVLKLIEEDADSFAKKAELYFKKRPELIALVEEFYRMYRSLAERYDHVTGELRKNIPSDLQSQGSGVSDLGSEPPSTLPSPDRKPSRTKSGPRAAGFDVFLGSGGSGSDLNSKEGDESSTLDSDSDSDDSSVNNYSSTQSNGDDHGFRRRIFELENELQDVKEKLHVQGKVISEGFKKTDHESSEFPTKIAAYEEELRVARENMEASKDEMSRLRIELDKYKSLGESNDVKQRDFEILKPEQNGEREIQESDGGSEGNQALERELRNAREKLRLSEEEVAKLMQEVTSKGSSIQDFQDQLKSSQKEVSVWKHKLEREKREASKLLDRIVRYKTNLADREQEIRGLKEAIANANKSLAEDNKHLQAEMTRMTKERAYLEDNIKEYDLRCQSLEEDVRRAKAAKSEMEGEIEQLKGDVSEREDRLEELNKNLDDLNAKIASLGAEMSCKDDHITQMSQHLHDLHMQHVELISKTEEACKSSKELESRVKELEMEVEEKQDAIVEGAEEKREAIRQLCLSIEHYRSGYHQLRSAVIAHKRPGIMAS